MSISPARLSVATGWRCQPLTEGLLRVMLFNDEGDSVVNALKHNGFSRPSYSVLGTGYSALIKRTVPTNAALRQTDLPQSPPAHRPATYAGASFSPSLVRFSASPAARNVVASSGDRFAPGVSFLGTAVRTEYTYIDF